MGALTEAVVFQRAYKQLGYAGSIRGNIPVGNIVYAMMQLGMAIDDAKSTVKLESENSPLGIASTSTRYISLSAYLRDHKLESVRPKVKGLSLHGRTTDFGDLEIRVDSTARKPASKRRKEQAVYVCAVLETYDYEGSAKAWELAVGGVLTAYERTQKPKPFKEK